MASQKSSWTFLKEIFKQFFVFPDLERSADKYVDHKQTAHLLIKISEIVFWKCFVFQIVCSDILSHLIKRKKFVSLF